MPDVVARFLDAIRHDVSYCVRIAEDAQRYKSGLVMTGSNQWREPGGR